MITSFLKLHFIDQFWGEHILIKLSESEASIGILQKLNEKKQSLPIDLFPVKLKAYCFWWPFLSPHGISLREWWQTGESRIGKWIPTHSWWYNLTIYIQPYLYLDHPWTCKLCETNKLFFWFLIPVEIRVPKWCKDLVSFLPQPRGVTYVLQADSLPSEPLGKLLCWLVIVIVTLCDKLCSHIEVISCPIKFIHYSASLSFSLSNLPVLKM